MAFAIPIVKKEYSLYANNSAPKQRRSSDQTDANRRIVESRRKMKSVNQSLSNSPSAAVVTGSGSIPKSKPMELKRVRSSAPGMLPVSQQNTPLHQKHSKALVRPSTSAPTGDIPPIQIYSPSRSSSSSSSSESTGAFGKFHSRLITRLRKTLRIKDPPEPTST